jgi:hypothetical protein
MPQRTPPRTLPALILTATALGGCDLADDGLVCPAFIAPAVMVTVTDSVSGAYLAEAADGRIQSGPVPLPLHVGLWETVGGQNVGVALVDDGGPAGTYRVEVIVPGYEAWVLTGVVVEQGPCQVETAELHARMQPSL